MAPKRRRDAGPEGESGPSNPLTSLGPSNLNAAANRSKRTKGADSSSGLRAKPVAIRHNGAKPRVGRGDAGSRPRAPRAAGPDSGERNGRENVDESGEDGPAERDREDDAENQDKTSLSHGDQPDKRVVARQRAEGESNAAPAPVLAPSARRRPRDRITAKSRQGKTRAAGATDAPAAVTAAPTTTVPSEVRNGSSRPDHDPPPSTTTGPAPPAHDSDAEDDIHTADVTTASIPRQTAAPSAPIPLPPPLAVPASAQSLRLRKWTQTISSRTVTGKWGKLSVPAQEAVKNLISNARRSVVQSASAGVTGRGGGGGGGVAARRIEEADALVGQVARSLARRIPVMVLPVRQRRRTAGASSSSSSARGIGDRARTNKDEDDGMAELFDIEAMMRRVARLEGELTTVLDAIKLADEEIEREREKVKMATEVVDELSANAKGMEKEWARWERQLPPSLRQHNTRPDAPNRAPQDHPDSILTHGIPNLSTEDPYSNLRRYMSQLTKDAHALTSPSPTPNHNRPTTRAAAAQATTVPTTATASTKTTVVDPAFLSVLDTLSNHLSSLEANHEPVKGVADEITKTEAAVQDMIVRRAQQKARGTTVGGPSAQKKDGHADGNGDSGSGDGAPHRKIHMEKEEEAAGVREWLMDILAAQDQNRG